MGEASGAAVAAADAPGRKTRACEAAVQVRAGNAREGRAACGRRWAIGACDEASERRDEEVPKLAVLGEKSVTGFWSEALYVSPRHV
jgi:hypothetical protein